MPFWMLESLGHTLQVTEAKHLPWKVDVFKGDFYMSYVCFARCEVDLVVGHWKSVYLLAIIKTSTKKLA